MGLIGRASLCPVCRRVVAPCPRQGCGKALPIEAAACNCANRTPLPLLAEPWCHLSGDAHGQRTGLLHWAHGDQPKRRTVVEGNGQALWAGRAGQQWTVLTANALHTEGGRIYSCPERVLFAVGLPGNGQLFVATPQGIFASAGQAFEVIVDVPAVRLWPAGGKLLVFSEDGRWRIVDAQTRGTVEGQKTLGSAPKGVAQGQNGNAFALTRDGVFELFTETGEVRCVSSDGGFSVSAYLGHLFVPGANRVRTFDEGRLEMHLQAEGCTPDHSRLTAWHANQTFTLGVLTMSGVLELNPMGLSEKVATTYNGEPTGWLVGFDGQSPSPRHLLAVRDPLGQSKLYDFRNGAQAIILEVERGIIRPIFTAHGVAALVDLGEGFRLEVFE